MTKVLVATPDPEDSGANEYLPPYFTTTSSPWVWVAYTNRSNDE